MRFGIKTWSSRNIRELEVYSGRLAVVRADRQVIEVVSMNASG